MSEYTERAEEFCKKHNVKVDFEFKECRVTKDFDNLRHNIYRVTIERDGKVMFIEDYYDSNYHTNSGIMPIAYDALTCLTKYEVADDMWDFARDFGYDIHDKESYKAVAETHKALQKEYMDVLRLFGDIMDELQEIE